MSRIDRIDELLRQEIGDLLTREVADPAVGFVTVTDVQTSPDLAHARVSVSLIGQQQERAAALAALRRAMPFIRHQLGERVRLRRIPELRVELDDSAERGTRVLQLLHELEEGRLPEDLPPVRESLPTPLPRARPEAGEPAPEPATQQAPEGAARPGRRAPGKPRHGNPRRGNPRANSRRQRG